MLLFSFKNLEGANLYNDPSFKGHAKAVASTLEEAVSLLRDLKTLVPILNNLGEKHAERGVLLKHYPVLGKALMITLKVGLKGKFSNNVK